MGEWQSWTDPVWASNRTGKSWATLFSKFARQIDSRHTEPPFEKPTADLARGREKFSGHPPIGRRNYSRAQRRSRRTSGKSVARPNNGRDCTFVFRRDSPLLWIKLERNDGSRIPMLTMPSCRRGRGRYRSRSFRHCVSAGACPTSHVAKTAVGGNRRGFPHLPHQYRGWRFDQRSNPSTRG